MLVSQGYHRTKKTQTMQNKITSVLVFILKQNEIFGREKKFNNKKPVFLKNFKNSFTYSLSESKKKNHLFYIHRHLFEICKEWDLQHAIWIEVAALGKSTDRNLDLSKAGVDRVL